LRPHRKSISRIGLYVSTSSEITVSQIAYISWHFIKQFLGPLILIGAILRLVATPPTGLVTWELASLVHTLLSAYSLMALDVSTPGLSVRTLQHVKFLVMVVVGMIVGGKLMLSALELLRHADLLHFVDEVSPHLIMAPTVLFFVINVVMYYRIRRARIEIGILDSRWETPFRELIVETDFPVVSAYVVMIVAALFSPDHPIIYRSAACTLLNVSNVLASIYEERKRVQPRRAAAPGVG
jgi:hypothetical protein